MPKKRKKIIKKKLKPKLHIYCEGEKTEPNYLRGYLRNNQPSNRRLKVIDIKQCKKNTPRELVQEAIHLKRSKESLDEDIFWVVYDREAISKYPNKLHDEALTLANENDIKVAISNVCFEVWILLHFSSSSRVYSSFKDLANNSPLKAELKKLGINEYDKGCNDLYDVLNDKVDLARDRAKKMNAATENSAGVDISKLYLLNPYTDIHKLLDSIDEFK